MSHTTVKDGEGEGMKDVERPKVPPEGKGMCKTCNQLVRLTYGKNMGLRLFLGKHTVKGKMCDGSYSDYTAPGEGEWDRW